MSLTTPLLRSALHTRSAHPHSLRSRPHTLRSPHTLRPPALAPLSAPRSINIEPTLRAEKRVRDLCKSIGGSKVANALSKADAEEQFVDTLVREVYGTKEEVDPTNLLFQAVEWKDAARAEALVCFGADPNARRHGPPRFL